MSNDETQIRRDNTAFKKKKLLMTKISIQRFFIKGSSEEQYWHAADGKNMNKINKINTDNQRHGRCHI